MSKKRFLWSLHYFRAFAIINIVILHLWRFPSLNETIFNNTSNFREVIFHNSTHYFIFISGFLFYYLKDYFRIRRYYLNKFKIVLLPYAITSTIVFLLFYLLNYLGFYNYAILEENIVALFMFGKVTPQLWYIPFVLLIFIISPLLLKIKTKYFNQFSPILFVLPILGTRTGTDITIGQYMYFFPVYVMGMYVAANHYKILLLLKKYNLFAISISFLSTIALVYLYYISYPKTNILESVSYIQKISIIAIILPILEGIKPKKESIADKIAKTSFAIYFIHYVLGRLQQPYLFSFLENYVLEGLWGLVSFMFPFLIIIECLLIIYLIKLSLRKYSKYVIGY